MMRYILALLVIVAFIVFFAFAFFGCAQIAGQTPSLQYCQKVDYHRDGNKMTIAAECQAPIGGAIIGP